MKLPVRPSVVWLDLDDTLIDFHAIARIALSILYKEAGLGRWMPDEETWVADYMKSNADLWRRYASGEVTREYLRIERMSAPLRPYFTGSAEELASIADGLDPQYLDIMAAQKVLMPGATEMLETLRKRGYRTGILSNGFKQVQYRKIDIHGLTPYIDLTVLSDHIGVNKPGIAIYRHAMELSGEMNPGRHVIIGDNLLTDIAGAVNAGWEAIYFDRQKSGEAIEYNGSYFTVKSLTDIIRLLPD